VHLSWMENYILSEVQTWMLEGEHCESAASRCKRKSLISSRGTEIGSGLMKLAAKEALATVKECAMS